MHHDKEEIRQKKEARRREERNKGRKKMNEIEIFMLGFHKLDKG